MRKSYARDMALGAVLAALAVVVMCLGGLIPVATYVCPVICMVLLCLVTQLCGRRIAWAWYGAVCLLGLLLAPDREAAMLFLFLGYYPIIKSGIDKWRFRILAKLVLFNAILLLAYSLMRFVLGLQQQLGMALLGITVLLGNITFVMLDLVLGRMERLIRKKA